MTIQLYDAKLDRSFALKTPRISNLAYSPPDFLTLDSQFLPRELDLEYNAFENERLISRRLSHQNIAQHVYGGWRTLKPIPEILGQAYPPRLPFSVSEWIRGARKLHAYLAATNPSIFDILELYSQALSALSYMEVQQVVHWDLKTDNVLVSDDGILKLIDFGNAKMLDQLTDGSTVATTTKGKFPEIKALEPLDTGRSQSRRFHIRLAHRSWHNAFIDLWMLSQEWNRLLRISPDFLQGEVTTAELDHVNLEDLRRLLTADTSLPADDARDCLKIIFDRILHVFSPTYEAVFTEPGGGFAAHQLYYNSITRLQSEIGRIIPRFGAGQNSPELLLALDDVVRLPVTGNSVFTPRVAALADCQLIDETKLHLQLAQVREVFPGATHTRFEHLLGTTSTAAYFVRSLYLNDLNGFWRVSADEMDIRAVLLAAIVHDIGHIAFGHFIEEMSDLMHGLGHEDYARAVLTAALKLLRGEGLIDDDLLVFGLEEAEIAEFAHTILEYWSTNASDADKLLNRVLSIFAERTAPLSSDAYLRWDRTREAIQGILRSIVTGPLDADKLDYLRRDSFHAGVFFAQGIDLERFFESLRACVRTGGNNTMDLLPVIGISDKGIAPAETVITSRYHLFSAVYWHRTVRCITAMLQRVLSEVRLALEDQDWDKFVGTLVCQFRRLDDRQALEWLRKELKRRKFLRLPLEQARRTNGLTVGDLLDALMGEREKYFKLAFELSYEGPALANGGSGVSPREDLYNRICHELYSDDAAPPTQAAATRKHARLCIDTYRKTLETAFSKRVEELVGSNFPLIPILIDVPEPGKDQIEGLFVDKRGKRNRRSGKFPLYNDGDVDIDIDFVELRLASPIASTLADVFKRWARKVRIYMAPADLALLRSLGFEPGDISRVWEEVLRTVHTIPRAQLSLRLAKPSEK